MTRFISTAAFWLALSSAPCSAFDGQSVTAPSAETEPSDEAFVPRYIQAFNDHDLEAMRSMWADDIEWIEVAKSDSKVIVTGASALTEAMQSYFAAFPDVRSQTSDVVVTGNLAAFVETVTWTRNGETFSQEALAIYQLEHGKIIRFWYLADD